MPATPPTIIAPLPNDPRVMLLAKSTGLTRREAFAVAAEAWAWMAAMAVDGIVPMTPPDSLDTLVDVAGFGQAMLEAKLVGVVDDGLVLPAELRRLERDERGGNRDQGDDGEVDAKALRRRESNRIAARKSRRKGRLLGKKTGKDASTYRDLGRVAGHEVRVYNGPHGCYAMLLGATVNGDLHKLTTGDKAWSLDTVRLVDTLPGLLEKWKSQSRPRGLSDSSPRLVPAYTALRDDVERLTALAKIEAGKACRHADGDDASSRHADASASSAGPSARPNRDDERKSVDDNGLDASSASANRHADAPSSTSVSPKSSSSHKEEDVLVEGTDIRLADDGGEPAAYRAYLEKKRKRDALARRFATALGADVEQIIVWWKHNAIYLRSRLEQAGIDANNGLPLIAEGSHEPAGARGTVQATTEPFEHDNAATGSVLAHRECDFTDDPDALRQALAAQGIAWPSGAAIPNDGATSAHAVIEQLRHGAQRMEPELKAACQPL